MGKMARGLYTDPQTKRVIGTLLKTDVYDEGRWLVRVNPLWHAFSHGWHSVLKECVSNVEWLGEVQ
jgi:hypothetical protein